MSGDAGRRVLVVEDEAMIIMLLEDMLTDLGYEVAGIAYSLEDGLKAAEATSIDLAILDINLNGKASFPVAGVLRSRGIPYIFATGYDPHPHGDDFRDVPILKKPFSIKGLSQALCDTLKRPGKSRSSNGTRGGNHRGSAARRSARGPSGAGSNHV